MAFKDITTWHAHYLPNDFVLGDNASRIREVVTAEVIRKMLESAIADAVPHQSILNQKVDKTAVE
jgi:hypothetical protein